MLIGDVWRSTVRPVLGKGLGRWRQLRVKRIATGLPPTLPRRDPEQERQRVEAIALVSRHAAHIRAAAAENNVPPEAVAGAIIWDGVENPYRRRLARLGPGRVRPIKLAGKSEARQVEEEGRVPRASGVLQRFLRLREPVSAIDYVAAIISRHADVYEHIAETRIRDDAGILCTLYQGGSSEKRAAQLARRRERDPSALPKLGNDMGPWVAGNLEFLRSLLGLDQSRRDAGGDRSLSGAAEEPMHGPVRSRTRLD